MLVEVKIRNVDPIAVGKIDRLAKELGVSRNEYLKKYVETLSVLYETKQERKKFEYALSQVTDVLEEQTLVLESLENNMTKILILVEDTLDVEADSLLEDLK